MANISKYLSPALLATELKSKCVDYVSEYLDDAFWQSEFGQELSKKAEQGETGELMVGRQEWIRQMDNFILFGETEDGTRVMDQIIANAKLNSEKKETLAQWRERAFPSIFEIKEAATDKVKVMDVLAEVDYEINFNHPVKGRGSAKGMPVGSFVQSNILPVKNLWFFSGSQVVLPKGSDPAIFQAYVAKASARQSFRNNPKKLRRALKIQKKHHKVFVDMFGTDELIVPPQQVRKKLREFYDKLAVTFNKSGKTTLPKRPENFKNAETVGIVMDEREGQYEFADYGKFVNIFETGDVSKKSKEFIMEYLEDESVPAFVFRRMKDRYPKNFHKVILETTARADRRMYPVGDFDKFMDIFKPNWRETYPAVIPMNQRFEKYYNLDRATSVS